VKRYCEGERGKAMIIAIENRTIKISEALKAGMGYCRKGDPK
jgi:hypothetical protein